MNYYRQYVGIMVDYTIISKLLRKDNNELLIHLDNIGSMIILQNILFKWLVSIFTENTSNKFYFCIWDIILLQGNIVMFKACLGLLKILTNEIIKQTSIETMMNIFDDNSVSLKSRKKLIYYLLVFRYDLDINFINHYRKKLISKTISSLQRPSNIHNKDNGNKKTICNEEWPFCAFEISSKMPYNDYIVFKQSSFPIFIDNYFNRKNSSDKEKKRLSNSFELYLKAKNILPIDDVIVSEQEMKVFNSLVIERKKHCCVNGKHNNCRTVGRSKTIQDSANSIMMNNHYSLLFNIDDDYYPDQSECITIINDISQNDSNLLFEDEVQKEWYENPEVFYETFT